MDERSSVDHVAWRGKQQQIEERDLIVKSCLQSEFLLPECLKWEMDPQFGNLGKRFCTAPWPFQGKGSCDVAGCEIVELAWVTQVVPSSLTIFVALSWDGDCEEQSKHF